MQQAAIHAGNLLVKLLLISMLVARQRGRCWDRRHPAPGGKPFRRAEHDGAMTEKGTTTDVALGYAISIDDYSGGPAAAVQVCCTATARLALLLSHPTLFSLTIGPTTCCRPTATRRQPATPSNRRWWRGLS